MIAKARVRLRCGTAPFPRIDKPMTRQPTVAFLLACGVCFTLVEPAYAYLDPGTGSMILQGIIGGAAAGLFVMKMQWARIKSRFGFGSAAADANKDHE